MYLNQTQEIYELTCDCEIVADGILIPQVAQDCDSLHSWNLTLIPKYAVNLRYLSELFDRDQLESFEGDSMLTDSVEIQLPPLAIMTKKLREKCRFASKI
jgi:hypothetical protein